MIYPSSGSLYKHYKGNYYEIVCVAKNSNTEEELVVYRCCATGTAYAHTLDEFFKISGPYPRFELVETKKS